MTKMRLRRRSAVAPLLRRLAAFTAAEIRLQNRLMVIRLEIKEAEVKHKLEDLDKERKEFARFKEETNLAVKTLGDELKKGLFGENEKQRLSHKLEDLDKERKEFAGFKEETSLAVKMLRDEVKMVRDELKKGLFGENEKQRLSDEIAMLKAEDQSIKSLYQESLNTLNVYLQAEDQSIKALYQEDLSKLKANLEAEDQSIKALLQEYVSTLNRKVGRLENTSSLISSSGRELSQHSQLTIQHQSAASCDLSRERNKKQSVDTSSDRRFQLKMKILNLEKTNTDVVNEFRSDAFAILNCMSVLFALSILCFEKTFMLSLVVQGGFCILWASIGTFFPLNASAEELAKADVLCREEDNSISLVAAGVVVGKSKWRFMWWHLLKVAMFTLFSMMYLFFLEEHIYQDQCHNNVFSILENPRRFLAI